ncbi:MAG TPA: hypothetical protein VKZ53_16010 [Candidatus Angelobacter sp.]|nr:hypothetical protein [Candidatus Angelobacter sp.]
MSYKANLLAVFDYLHKNSWGAFLKKDFWHTANTLDTCVDFILNSSPYWTDLSKQRQAVQTMIQDSYQYFDTVYREQNDHGHRSRDVWWDDYGWWGVTFTKIYQNFEALFRGAPAPTITAADCLDVARKCWTVLGSYSEHANRTVKPEYKGPVAGGCWNHPPKPDGEGVQNSVTNELFLVLSARLYKNTNDQSILTAVAGQYLWFTSWFVDYLQKQAQCPLPGNQQGAFRCLARTQASRLIVAYERPIDPMNSKYNQGQPPFVDGQLWTADQGLLLGGLAEVLSLREALASLPIIRQQDPTFPKNAKDMIYWGVLGIDWLFDPTSVLHEAPLHGEFRTGYAADYATGKGVMMRYLKQAMGATGLNPDTYITQNAKAVLNSMSKDYQLAFQWNTRTDTKIGTNESDVQTKDLRFPPTVQVAGMDALNAGIQLLHNS